MSKESTYLCMYVCIYAPNIAREQDLVFGFCTQASRYARRLVARVSLAPLPLATLPKRESQLTGYTKQLT